MSTPHGTPGDHPGAPGTHHGGPHPDGSWSGARPSAGAQPPYGGPTLRGPHPDGAYGVGSAGYWRASQDDRTLALLSHLGALLVSALVPLIVFLIKKDDSPFVREHTRQSLNLQIMLLIAGAVCGLLMFVLVGFLLLPLVVIAGWVLQIIAAVRASNGEMYRIPFVIDFVK